MAMCRGIRGPCSVVAARRVGMISLRIMCRWPATNTISGILNGADGITCSATRALGDTAFARPQPCHTFTIPEQANKPTRAPGHLHQPHRHNPPSRASPPTTAHPRLHLPTIPALLALLAAAAAATAILRSAVSICSNSSR